MLDTPTIASSAHTHSTYALGALAANNAAHAGFLNANAGNGFAGLAQGHQQLKQENIPMAAAPTRRLVQVFIADPNENIPLTDSLLYSGDQKLTDATDQELFFEIDIKDILAKHNEKRAKTVDKKVKERVEYLEPAKIRDLKMVVVNVASF